MTHYVLVKWPESQELYGHKRFNECYHLVEGEDDFMVPVDIYYEFIIFNNKLYIVVDVRYVLLDNGTVDKAHIFITEK